MHNMINKLITQKFKQQTKNVVAYTNEFLEIT